MSKFKRVICYCLIFNIFFNNILTSFANTAWASSQMTSFDEDQNLRYTPRVEDDQSFEQTQKIPAKQAVIGRHIAEEWSEKYTLSGFTVLRFFGVILSIVLGILIVNAWEPINAKTLFPALGIPKLGVGTENAFYEATAATHWMFFAGIPGYSYSIFKFGLKTANVLTNTVKSIAFKARSCRTKPESIDLEKTHATQENEKNEEEKLAKAKQQIFRKWSIPKFLGYIIPGAINVGSGFIYSMIMVDYLRRIELPHFPNFFNFFGTVLTVAIMTDKSMTGHAKTREIFEWVEEKWDKTAQLRHRLKNKIEQAIIFVENLDLKKLKDKNILRRLIENILPQNEAASVLEEEDEELDTINNGTSDETNLSGSIDLLGENPVESGENSNISLAVPATGARRLLSDDNLITDEDLVEPNFSSINFEKLFDFIKQHNTTIEDSHKSKLLRWASYGISAFGTWGLATVMTQSLESMSGNPLLATILGGGAAGWIAFAESEDIYKALKDISLTPQTIINLFKKPGFTMSLGWLFLRHVLYPALLASTGYAYTFVEFAEYLNTQEPYTNVFTTINNQIPAIKYGALPTFYLFELLSYWHFQDRTYKASARRGKQALVCSLTRLYSYQERLIGSLETTLKSVDILNKEGLTALAERLFPKETENDQITPRDTPPRREKEYFSDDSSQDEARPLIINQVM